MYKTVSFNRPKGLNDAVLHDRHFQRQQALLDMLVGGDRMRSAVERLVADDWSQCLVMARQHRLAPLLHWRLAQEGLTASIPQRTADALAQEFRRCTLRALSLQRDMAFVRQSLMEVGIEGVFLKGAFLAYHAYPQAALRPLRDIDVWVPEERALEAFDALLKAGGRWKDRTHNGMNMGSHKHLPALVAPLGGTSIELHPRLAMPIEAPKGDSSCISVPDILQRLVRRPMPGGVLTYLSPTDQLLHVLIHAAYDHRLNNGPLVLTDIAFLLTKEPIDWTLFWQLADKGGWTSGCGLLLRLADHFHGPLPMPPLASVSPELLRDQLATTATLMLSNFDHRADVAFGADLTGLGYLRKRVNSLLGRIFPPRELMSARKKVLGGRSRLSFAYLVYGWRLITVKFPRYWLGRRDARFRRETLAHIHLRGWLRCER